MAPSACRAGLTSAGLTPAGRLARTSPGAGRAHSRPSGRSCPAGPLIYAPPQPSPHRPSARAL